MASSINVKIAPLPRGDYSSSATYAKLDVVSYNGSSYMAIKAVPTGTVPTNTTYWQLFAEKPTIGDGTITTNMLADGAVSMDSLGEDVMDTLYASFPVDTASGDIASFEDGADNVPVRELKLNLEPYQNLNGYDSPWVGGAGKNLLPITISSQTYHGITLTVNADGSITINGTASELTIFILTSSLALPDGTYVINGCPSGGGSSTYRLDVNDGSIGQDTGGSATFNVSGGTGISNVRLRIASGYTANNLVFWPMIRIAGQSNTFEPYENICPIYPANGKNLLPKFTSGTASNLTYTVNDDGSVHVTGTNTGTVFYAVQFTLDKGDYILSGAPKDGQLTIRNALGGVAPSAEFSGTFDDYGSEVRFSVSATASAWLNIRTVAGTWDTTYYPMIRHAEVSSPTYVPQDSLGIVRTGKNLLSQNSIFKGTLVDANLAIGNIISTVHRTAIIKLPQGSWTFTFPVNVLLTRLVKDGTYSVISNSNIKTYTITTTTDGWVGLSWRDNTSSSTNWNDSSVTQLEKGSASTGIEPYSAERYYPISDNPVYGGTLEVETGVLTVTRGTVMLNGTESWTISGASSGEFYTPCHTLVKKTNYTGSIVCDKLQVTSNAYSDVFFNGQYVVSGYPDTNNAYPNQNWIYLKTTDDVVDANALKTWLASNPVTLVYELVTPQTYQLTPVQVKTLLGYNNIWTDSGTVEVQYRANIGLYIQKIIGATEDDMVANQNISANKYFFVGEELYYSTSAISAGQTIIVGTNCIKTTLADALNALNS